MSNKRRKSIGSQKIARNLAIRVLRGATKAGTPPPGHSRTYSRTDITLDANYHAHGDKLREQLHHYTAAYWRGA